MTQQFKATATYINLTTGAYSTPDVTTSVTWSSSAATIASIGTSGLAKGLVSGVTDITASMSGVTSFPSRLNVMPAQLQSVTISPTSATIAAGQTQKFTVTGSYSDGTTQDISSSVSWTSSNTAVAGMGASGAAFGLAPAATPVTITASYGGLSVAAPLTVSNYSVSGTLAALPAGSAVTIQNGADSLTLTANGTFMFPTSLATGSPYNVTVTTQPGGTAHPCTVVDGSGTITTNFISFVQVVCGPAVSTVAGWLTIHMNPPNGTMILPYMNAAAGVYAGGLVDGTGTAAQFNGPAGAAYDSLGNLYVADSRNNVIRKMTPAGVVTTFAGSGTAGLVNTSATVTALQTQFNWPMGVAVDAANNVYVADASNHVIRKITQAGVVTTLAGSGTAGSANNANALSATFNTPHGVAVDAANNVYVADTLNNMIRKIAPNGTVTTFAGNATTPLVNGTGTAASFNMPTGIVIDKTGTTLYVADNCNSAIRGIVIASALVYTVAGSGMGYLDGPTATAQFSLPNNVAVDSSNNIYVTDGGTMIRKIVGSYTAGVYSGTVTTLAGASGVGLYSFADGFPAGVNPSGIAVDASNNVFITEDSTNLIRKYTP